MSNERKFRDYQIDLTPREQIEPEEIFFDDSKVKEFESGGIDAGKIERPISKTAVLIFEIIQIFAIGTLGVFTAFMVLAKGEYYSTQAEENSSRITLIPAERGSIFSSDGELLASNEIYFDVILILPKLNLTISKVEDLSKHIANVVGESSPDEITRKIIDAKDRKFSELSLLKAISSEELGALGEDFSSSQFIEIRQVTRRLYPEGGVFSHILGYTGEASQEDLYGDFQLAVGRIGKAGIEAFYDEDLRGTNGSIIKGINSRGEVLEQELSTAAQRGNDIVLNIDSRLQNQSYAILKESIRELGLDSAVVILLNPQNGAILAMVSLPSFDVNLFEKGISQSVFTDLLQDPRKPLFNRAISGEYPSASTIKPMIAAAALEEKLVTEDFLIYSAGVINVPSMYNSEVVYSFKDWKVHGWTDIRKAIADSVNIYFYTIGGGYENNEGLGIRKIGDYLDAFGWGKKLGVDLIGEKNGLIPSPKWKKEYKGENWYVGDTYHTSIGQGDILVTPLHVVAMAMVFANNGTLFSPRVAMSIGGEAITTTIINSNFISADNIRIVREGMRQAVTSGSSRFLANSEYSPAGKTGTAQSNSKLNHAWFTGFAPYEDPSVVIAVLLEEGDTSNNAVHVAKRILDMYFEQGEFAK